MITKITAIRIAHICKQNKVRNITKGKRAEDNSDMKIEDKTTLSVIGVLRVMTTAWWNSGHSCVNIFPKYSKILISILPNTPKCRCGQDSQGGHNHISSLHNLLPVQSMFAFGVESRKSNRD
jgi:hypothetical protein